MLHSTAFIAALAVGLTITLVPAASYAQAPATDAAKSAAKAAPKKEAAPKAKLGPNQKQCKSKQPSGTIKTWTCGKDQPCCVSHEMNLYTCGSQLLKCF